MVGETSSQEEQEIQREESLKRSKGGFLPQMSVMGGKMIPQNWKGRETKSGF